MGIFIPVNLKIIQLKVKDNLSLKMGMYMKGILKIINWKVMVY